MRKRRPTETWLPREISIRDHEEAIIASRHCTTERLSCARIIHRSLLVCLVFDAVDDEREGVDDEVR